MVKAYFSRFISLSIRQDVQAFVGRGLMKYVRSSSPVQGPENLRLRSHFSTAWKKKRRKKKEDTWKMRDACLHPLPQRISGARGKTNDNTQINSILSPYERNTKYMISPFTADTEMKMEGGCGRVYLDALFWRKGWVFYDNGLCSEQTPTY